MGAFRLVSKYKPAGDQPQAIEQLVKGILQGKKHQVLLGVTGSGKTFTIANVIERVQKPTLVISHNKTLAAQLYGEFKRFFPENAVNYFISYYDYYQPEAYIPSQDKYIEKDLLINKEIEKYRIAATTELLSGRRDVIIVASVSAIYGLTNPQVLKSKKFTINVGMNLDIDKLLQKLVEGFYSRNDEKFTYGTFRVKGDSIDIYTYLDVAYKVIFWDDEVEEIYSFDPHSGMPIQNFNSIEIYPTSFYSTSAQDLEQIINQIRLDLAAQVEYFKSLGKYQEAQRLIDRVNYDIEMIKEIGHCKGIENYSRYFDGRAPGTRPFTLLDYFPEDFLIIIDESHVTIPQLRAMYAGDRSRKQILVDYGFRLPAALDNRPLKFEEFMALANQIIYMSATPGPFELQQTKGYVVEQVVRPTGLVDPPIEIRPTHNQIDDLIAEINKTVSKNQRVLITTLTKRMAEDLTEYLNNLDIKTAYIHSDIDALERVKIMESLREGKISVLVGVNLLREGLDLPEVSLVAILDADKEGFLRSETALTQTAGRAARNLDGKVILYADKITDAIRKTIAETNRRREKQLKYNKEHGIIPKQVIKDKTRILYAQDYSDLRTNTKKTSPQIEITASVANTMSKTDLKTAILKIKKEMLNAADKLDFKTAAYLRDEMLAMIEIYENRFSEKIKI